MFVHRPMNTTVLQRIWPIYTSGSHHALHVFMSIAPMGSLYMFGANIWISSIFIQSYWTELIIYEAKVITVSQFKWISSQHSDEIHVLRRLIYHPVHSPLGSFDLYYFLLINRMVIHVPQTCLKKRYLKISRVSSRTSGLF